VKPAPVHPRRLVYLGTPAAAVPPLRALHGAGFVIPLVVSRADTRRGRGGALVPSPVKAAALELGIPVSDRVDDVLAAGADLGVVVAYGRIIKPHVLAEVPMVNLHFSLLPRWRGAAPVERAILAGDTETGVCVMTVEEGLDTGGVHRRAVVPIGEDTTADELREELVAVGTGLLLASLTEGLGEPEPQTGEATYAAKIEPAELEIDWSRPALAVRRLVRLGGAWTSFRGRRLKVWSVRPSGTAALPPGGLEGTAVGTGDGDLVLVEVQPEGRGRQSGDAWRNGARPVAGERLGS
jgi:methionyl-tRNA formyltransferase